VDIQRVGDVQLGWGESLVWDDRAERLYFVDCAAQTLHWLDGGEGDLHTLTLPSMAAGLVPTDDGALLGALDDGLHRIDPDAGTAELVAGGRANDACADPAGNVITGTLNLGPDEGSAWWWSATDGWRLLDDDISNTNGPAVLEVDGETTLIVGDTSKDYFSYPYDPATGTVGERSVFGDTSGLDGLPDGATVDADGGFWCALVGGSQLARFTSGGLDRTVALPVANPTDVTFAGPDLDRLYVVSIAAQPGALDGALLRIDGLDGPGARGRPEPRCSLGGRP
jgi:sugar lactone lactonase YvrE